MPLSKVPTVTIVIVSVLFLYSVQVESKPHGITVVAPVAPAYPVYPVAPVYPAYPYYAVPKRCYKHPHACHHFYGGPVAYAPPPPPPPPPVPYYGGGGYGGGYGGIGGVKVAAVGVGIAVGKK